MALMKKIHLLYTSVRTIGYVRDNRFQCSSLGVAAEMPLGPAASVRPSMGTTFVAVEH
jgi:sensor c-di-GMP phosphodiesterase-like protein